MLSSVTCATSHASPFHTSHISGGLRGSTPMPSACAENESRSAVPARLSENPRWNASPGVSSGEAKQATPARSNRTPSHTSVARSPWTVVVIAANSLGGEITRSREVVNTTASALPLLAPAVVIACVPAGTTTGVSSTVDNQNVRSTRAADGGNGSMPTMFRKWT